MKFARRLAAVVSLTVGVALASAQQAGEKQGVWRFVDANTVAVGRMDLAAYDLGAFKKWYEEIIKANTDAKTAETAPHSWSCGSCGNGWPSRS